MPGIDEIPNNSIIEKIPLGILVLDSNYIIQEWNKVLENWTGKSKDTVLGLDLRVLYPNISENKYQSRFNALFKGGPPMIFSSQLHKYLLPIEVKNGLLARQQVTVSPLENESGEVLAMICIQDVTDLSDRINAVKVMRDQALDEIKIRKKVEVELEELNKEFQAFSSRVAHDLRGPFSLCSSLSDLGLIGDPSFDMNDLFQRIKKASGEGLRIVEGLYKLSGLTSDKLIYSKVDLNKMVLDVCDLMDLDIAKSNLKIENECQHTFEGCAEVLPQVFQNFISNAMKYCQVEKPMLRISSEEKGDLIVLHFEDNGPGIPEKERGEIFKSFFRLKQHSKLEGVGLGLSLVKKVLDMHKAQLMVGASENLGGARFSISFSKTKQVD